MFNVYLTARKGALPGASGDQTVLLSFYLQNTCCRAKHGHSFLEPFFVVIDALIFAYLRSFSFDIVFILFRSLLGSIMSSQADLPTLKNLDFASAGARFLKNQSFDPMMVLKTFWGSLGLLLVALGGPLGALWGL